MLVSTCLPTYLLTYYYKGNKVVKYYCTISCYIPVKNNNLIYFGEEMLIKHTYSYDINEQEIDTNIICSLNLKIYYLTNR